MKEMPRARKMACGVRVTHYPRKQTTPNNDKHVLPKTCFGDIECHKGDANRIRIQDLQSLLPTSHKKILKGSKPTKSGGGRILQPGGGFAGN
jgi:hypothetical protein